jgi:hypothetical protein
MLQLGAWGNACKDRLLGLEGSANLCSSTQGGATDG